MLQVAEKEAIVRAAVKRQRQAKKESHKLAATKLYAEGTLVTLLHLLLHLSIVHLTPTNTDITGSEMHVTTPNNVSVMMYLLRYSECT